jgi:BirA family biotin operon repressor/biotin-[acetyl-CoA-carboxylase] ligase
MPRTDQLESDKITANLNTKRIGKKILVYNSLSSTNDIAAEYAKDKENDGLVILAEEQTAGRGRAGNKWLSNPSDSILCSILLINESLEGELLSLTCAVAVAEAVGNNAKIKWPNDIILNGKKIAGILLESKINNSQTAYIIGIGINCHQQIFPPELKSIATSLDIETGSTSDRISLTKRLLISIDHWLEQAKENSQKVVDKWQQLSIQLNHRITVIYNSRKFTGNCIGIDPKKGLILQLDSGGTRFFDAAHTSIAK